MKVNISKVIKEKAGKKLGQFLSPLSFLVAKVIHQDEINEILELYGDKVGVEFISHVLDYLKIERVVEGLENIDSSKRYIFASNHPLGGIDGFVIAEALSGACGDVRLVVNDILMNISPLSSIFLPINKHGRQSVDYARQIGEALEGGVPMLYFPAGLCSRKIDGVICDLKWNSSFIKKAKESNRDIIPIYVDSVNSTFFYNFALWRKRLGVKLNIEMALLPSEMFKKRNATIRLVIGKPIKSNTLIGGGAINSSTLSVREECYKLASQK